MNRQKWVFVLFLGSASVLSSSSARADSPNPVEVVGEAPSVPDPQAVADFQQGRDAFERGDTITALDLFRRSYDRLRSPNTLLFVARAERALGRLAIAWETYVRVAREAAERSITEPRYAPAAEAARSEAQALLPRIARVQFITDRLPTDASIIVGTRVFTREHWNEEFAVEPGSLSIEVRMPDGTSRTQTVVTTAGVQQRITIDAPVALPARDPAFDRAVALHEQQQTQRARRLSNIGWIVGGVGAGASVVSFVLLGVAENQYQSLRLQCGTGRCPSNVPDLSSRVSMGTALQTSGNLVLAAGLLLMATSGGLLIASTIRPPPPERPPTFRHFVVPTVMSFSNGVQLQWTGTF